MMKAKAKIDKEAAAQPISGQIDAQNPVVAAVTTNGDDDDEEYVEPPLDASNLPKMEKDFTSTPIWTLEEKDLVVQNVNGKPEIFVVKKLPNGNMALGSPNFSFPPCKAIFVQSSGIGEVSKMGTELEFSFLASPHIPPEMESRRAEITEQWNKTFEKLKMLTHVLCSFLASNPTCNADIYDDLLVKVKAGLSPADSSLEQPYKFDAAGAKVNKKNSERNADMAAYKKIIRDAIYKMLVDMCQVHWNNTCKYTDDREDRSLISTFTISSSNKAFKPLYDKVKNKSFEEACPEIAKYLLLPNKQDERYLMANSAKAYFYAPNGPDKKTGKIVDQRKILFPIRTYCKEPKYDEKGFIVRGNDGKPVLTQRVFGIFERRLTNGDVFTFECFMGPWNFSKKGFGLLSMWSSTNIIIHREHSDFVRAAPTTAYDDVVIAYPERRELPPMQAHGKRPGEGEGSEGETNKKQKISSEMEANYNAYASSGPEEEDLNGAYNTNQ